MHQGAYRRCSLSLILFLVIFSISDIDSQLREYISNLTNSISINIFLQHKCYILATVDRDLKRRVRKIPGVPIMYISNHR